MTTYTRYIVKTVDGYLVLGMRNEMVYALKISDAKHFATYEEAACWCIDVGHSIQKVEITCTVEDA